MKIFKRDKKFRRWLDNSENWKLIDFWYKVFSILIAIAIGLLGYFGGKTIITSFREVKADLGSFKKLEVCDEAGNCMVTTPGPTSTIEVIQK